MTRALRSMFLLAFAASAAASRRGPLADDGLKGRNLLQAYGASSAAEAPPAPEYAAGPVTERDEGPVSEHGSEGRITQYHWHVTVASAAPDCFVKDVVLVNGEFQPTIRVRQGDTLQVVVHNDLPSSYPMNSAGISIHWHGLSLQSPDHSAQWYDGVPYVHQCPIPAGSSFKYRFSVTDPPGTYFWHDHASAIRADGLSGPLIILPPVGVTPAGAPAYDAEETIYVQDWFHAQGPVQAFSLNRPFDSGKVTNASGAWQWVGLPQSVLLNGNAFYGDCALQRFGGNATIPCNVTTPTVPPNESSQQPSASAFNPGCTHYNTTVETGKTYLYRIINGGTLTYQTLCFEGHTLTAVAADAIPIDPLPLPNGCVDVNAGQRMDILLKANQNPRAYYITSNTQFRAGSPNGYGFLRYAGTNASALPPTPTPQPDGVKPWNDTEASKVHVNAALLPALAPPPATTSYGFNLSQPLVQPTGQIRWALNNVAHTEQPSCQSLLPELQANRSFLIGRNAGVGPNNTINPLSVGVLGTQDGSGGPTLAAAVKSVYLDETFPITPVAGLHVVQIKSGDVVEIVIQNNPANAFNGDYRLKNDRTASEQHPFHLHGSHFWVMATGAGDYSAAEHGGALNTVNAPYRDTVSILKKGWAVIRFRADNPGVWLLHCHILWHQMMGQGLLLSESPQLTGPPPADLPACPASCPALTAPWKPATVQALFGSSGFEIGGR